MKPKTRPLYPPEDKETVLKVCAEAHRTMSRLIGGITPAIVFQTWHTDTPSKYWYSWRFNPHKRHKIGDIIGPEYGYMLLIIGTVTDEGITIGVTAEENPQP